MRGDAGMATSGRRRDYVATQLALRRDAVLKEKHYCPDKLRTMEPKLLKIN